MKKTTNLVTFVMLLAFSLTFSAFSQQYSGDLGPGDNKLSDGEYYDTYYENFTTGQRVTITMQSGTFDSYLMLTDPDGDILQNDDYEEDNNDAQLVVVIERSGEYKIMATTYEGGITGSYRVDLKTERTNFANHLQQNFRGALAAGDNQLEEGEYSDIYYVDVTAGQIIEVDLRSSEIDPYLVLFPPTANQIDNDDYGKKTDRSHISYRATESGQYKIMVTTYEAGETGSYHLSVQFDLGGSSSGGSSGIRKN